MDSLARLYDATSRRVLESTGVAPGWRCLEIGGGSGGLSRWLAARVGPRGSVLCTDIDTSIIERHRTSAPANLEVRLHDVAQDPLPVEHFDLAYARLVLIHLPQRERVLENLVRTLKPGGWLVIEDFDNASLLPDASISRFETPLRANEAVRLYLTRSQDGYYGRRLYGRFRELGLTQVASEARVIMFDRDNGGADLLRLNFEQLGAELIAAGLVTREQIDADLAALTRADFALPSPVMWSTVGRRPAT